MILALWSLRGLRYRDGGSCELCILLYSGDGRQSFTDGVLGLVAFDGVWCIQ